MKVVLAGLLTLAGLVSATAFGQPARVIDPKTVLFTISTLADDTAPVTPLKGKPGADDLALSEDSWRQIEFFPANREQEIRQALLALKAFEAEQRAPNGGWKKPYLRKLPDQPVIAGKTALGTLAKDLGVAARPAPVVTQGANTVVGRVTNGFTLPIGRGVSLYGTSDANGIAVLAANVREGAEDDALLNAFLKLNAKHQMILVDWRAHLLLLGIAPGGSVRSWRP